MQTAGVRSRAVVYSWCRADRSRCDSILIAMSNAARCPEDERYIATSTSTEVIIVDLVRHRIATLPVLSRGGGYAGFARPGALVISNASGLMTVSLESLEFIDYAISTNQH